MQRLLDTAQSKSDAGARLRALINAMDSAHSAHDRYGEADGAFFAGRAAEGLFEWSKAIMLFKKALALYKAVGAHKDVGIALHEIGLASDLGGDRRQALEFFEKALPVEERAGDLAGRASTLLAIGKVYDENGQRQTALGFCEKALEIFHKSDPRREAIALNYVGKINEELGRRQEAMGDYRKALILFERFRDNRGRAETLTNIGVTLDNLGDQNQALQYYREALPLWLDDISGQGATLNDIGKALKELGDYRQALDYYERALSLRRKTGDLQGEAVTLNNIGRVHFELAEPQKALEYYEAALLLEREVGERSSEAITLRNSAYALEKLGLTEPAIAIAKQCVNLFQTLRSELSKMNREVQRSYSAEVQPAYRLLADLLISRGRLAEAQQAMDLLKDDEYFNFIRSSRADQVDLTKSESDWKVKYDALGRELAKDASEFEALDRLGKVQALARAQVARKSELEQKLQASRQAFQAFLKSAQTAFALAAADKERLDDLKTYTQLASLVKGMPDHPAAIYTLVTEDGIRTILTLPNITELKSSPRSKIKFEDLSKKVQLLRTALTDPRLDPIPVASELYDILIRPLEKDLEAAGVQSLMFSLDGPLRYLPLAALYDDQTHRWLSQKYPISLFSPSNLLGMKDTPGAIKAAGFGVTTDHDVKGLHFPGLTGVDAELGSLRKSMGASIFEDSKFTARAMKDELDRGDTLIHMATHFELKAGDASNSFLVLGDGKALSISEFAGWRQNVLEGVDLFVISACDTATPTGDGGEFESFARAAQENGAAAVLATLWPVNDASTALFMSHFYELRKRNPSMTKTEAIRQTQMWLMNCTDKELSGVNRGNLATAHAKAPENDQKPYKPDPNHPFAHPYYWAPFVLTGNVK